MTSSLPLHLIPSLPASSLEELQTLTEALAGTANGFQIDIVDGVFVPSVSWPFGEEDPIGALQQITTLPQSLMYELDCMVDEPEQYLEEFLKLPLETIIIHVGSTRAYEEIFSDIKAAGMKAGLAFTSEVTISEVEDLIPHVDLVQVMGIETVGKQGQPFDERALERVAQLRHSYPHLTIAVDGGVNASTIPRLRAAGANQFAPGSAISQSADPVAAYEQLKALLV